MDTKKLFTFLILGLFLILLFSGSVSANIRKEFNIDTDKSLNSNTKYGEIKLYDRYWIDVFGWFEKEVKEITLKENTDYCSDDCYAITDIELLEDGKLIDDVEFYTIENEKRIRMGVRNYSFSIYKGNETIVVDDYEYKCDKLKTIAKNGSLTNQCELIKTGSHNETKEIWENYNYEDVRAGNYTIKLTGSKKPSRTVDWVIISNGIRLDEWAEWAGITYTYDEHSYGVDGTGGITNQQGIKITSKVDGVLRNVTLFTGCTANRVTIYDSSLNPLQTGTVVSGNASFSVNLTAHQDYTILAHNAGNTSYTRAYANVGVTLPEIETNVNFTAGKTFAGEDRNTIYNIKGVVTSVGEDKIINLSIPEDNYYSGNNTVVFNSSYELDSTVLINTTLWIDNNPNETKIISGTTNTSQWIKELGHGIHNWTVQACDSDDTCGFADNRSFYIDLEPPNISIANNLTNITTFSLPTQSVFNYTASDDYLEDCYYNTSDDITYEIITCNQTAYTINWTAGGMKTINYCANDSAGLESCNSENIYIDYYGYTQTDRLDPIAEDNNQTYTLIVNTTGLELPTTTAYLYLNNTLYYPTTNETGTTQSNFSYSLIIPSGWGNSSGNVIDWYWNYTIDGLVTNQSTDLTNTTVTQMGVDDCSIYGTPILNLSLLDEGDLEFFNLSAETTNIEIDLQLTSEFGTIFNYNTTWTNENNVSVCVPNNVLNTTNFTIDFTIGYDSSSYVNEFYYLDNGTLSNLSSFDSLTDKTINLYDLLATDSTSFLFNYFDEDGLIVRDIIVHVFRKYIGAGEFREVERAKQNDDGNTVVHLVEEDVIYYFIISQNGTILFTSNTYTALCQDTPCEIQLSESGGFQEFNENWDLIDNGGYSISSNSVTREVNLTYSLTSPSTMNLTIYKLDNSGNYEYINSSQATGTSNVLTVYVPTSSGNTSFFATIEQDEEYINSEWIDFEEDFSVYAGNELSLFIGGIMILTLGLMAISSGVLSIVFLSIGMVMALILGLVDYRTTTGMTLLIYFIVVAGIFIWKLTRRNR